MGVSISRYSEISANEYCLKFCSSEPISHNDPFWNKFLAFNIKPPANAEEQLFFDSSVESLLESFLAHNPRTGNLGSLVQVFITRATELLTQPTTDCLMLAWQTYNALFVIRFVSKFLIEMIPESQLCLHFDVQIDRRLNGLMTDGENVKSSEKLVQIDDESKPSPITTNAAQSKTISVSKKESYSSQNEPKVFQKNSPRVNVNESKLEMLIDTLVGLIINVPVNDETYYLHLECVNTLLVLMSVYMFAQAHGNQRHIETSLIFRTLFQGRYCMHAPLIVKTLLQNFSAFQLAPENMFKRVDQGGSVVMGIASGLWSILTLSAGSKRESILTRQLRQNENLTDILNSEHPLAVQSCLLLLAFTNHSINEDNLYRKAVFCMQDHNYTDNPTQTASQQTGPQITPPRININALHTAICATASCEHATLLLYLLLNGCKLYWRYINSVPHIENLLLPILRSLYSTPYLESYSHHLYMTVIVLLKLTEDEQLSRSFHQIEIKTPLWYSERSINGLTLGGLCALVVIRALYASTVKIKDQYIHINCLASLANMSGEFRNLHPYVAQRLISLIESIYKRIKKLSKQLEESGANLEVENSQTELVDLEQENLVDNMLDNMEALETVLRMLLEIINSCLSNQLQNNLNLVYALLYKKEMFEEIAEKKSSPVAQNIVLVIGFFTSRLERARDHTGSELGVTEVFANIQKSAQQWKSDRLKKFPELKFRYIEDERLEDFFTPYVWGLISNCGNIYWTSEHSNRVLKDVIIC